MSYEIPSDDTEIGRRIRALAVLRGRTTAWISEETGIDGHRIENLSRKNSQTEPKEEELQKIAQALEGNLDWLKTGRGNPLLRELSSSPGDDAMGLRAGLTYNVSLVMPREDLSEEKLRALFPQGLGTPKIEVPTDPPTQPRGDPERGGSKKRRG